MQKRILTIQDYSALGRCSLTVALPIISSMQIETVGLPTAILSNHTAFPSFDFVDLTSSMESFVSKWDGFNNLFDTIYTGYLAKGQADIVLNIIKKLKKENTKILIDPAFADSGKLYPGFDLDHVNDMKKLISISDYIVPNLSEACFLTDTEYDLSNLNLNNIVIDKLLANGAKNVILTGVRKDNKVGSLFKSKQENFFYGSIDLHTKFHGTGDVFASALASCLTLSLSNQEAIKTAHDFVTLAMEKTIEDKVNGILYGPEFEKALYLLTEKSKEYNK